MGTWAVQLTKSCQIRLYNAPTISLGKTRLQHNLAWFLATIFSDGMVLFSTLTLAGLAAAASLVGAATIDSSEEVSGNVATGAFILECESTQNLDELVKAVQDQGGEIRRQFKSKVFYGISVQLHNTTMTGHGMEQMPGVTKVWPVEVTKQPVEPQTVQQPGSQRRDNSAPWNHIMTQVDKLHAAGFTGSGIRIAVVDTGVSLPCT